MSLTRNTIFAVLMAIEQDLRRACVAELSPGDSPLVAAELDAAKNRFRLDKGGEDDLDNWRHLLDYLDLSQLLDVLSRNAAAIGRPRGRTEREVRDLTKLIRGLVPTRNRVCHARPLEPDDLVLALDTSDRLAASNQVLGFAEVAEVRQELARTGTYPLTLTIPSFWREDVSVIDNNLPVPEFDDTGFIGRAKDRENLIKHLVGPHPLITVTGEGGVGKTALTVRCLYDIVDRRGLYDAIVWTTLKANRLTPAGVRSVVGALTSEVDILASIAERFGPQQPNADLPALFAQVTEILESMSVLLVIDNLESLPRDAFRPLFESIPRRSKIVLTSRIGIGELELRYPLQPMEPMDAVRLLRTTARLFNVDDLARRDSTQLEDVAQRLFHNPLAIRWFVQSYSTGRSIGALLDRRRNLEDLLTFCFQNLYETLDENSTRLLRVLVALGKPLSEVQLTILSDDRDIERTRTQLQYLYSSNLVMRARDEWGNGEAALWTTSEFARQYITSRDKQLPSERGRVLPIYRALITARDTSRAEASGNAFRNRVIRARSTDEAMVVRSLTEALAASNRGLHNDALEHVRTAQRLLPDFFEVWRVSAQVKDVAGDAIGAAQDFETAVDLADGQSEPLLVFYAQFLRRQDNFERAVQVLESAATKPEATHELVASYAWMLTLSARPVEAVEVFGSVHEELLELTGPGRAYYITQYVETLRRASEQERRRSLPDDAMQYLLQALGVVRQAVTNGIIDDQLVATTQECCRDACFLLSQRCLDKEWHSFAGLAAELAPHFDLVGPDDRGANRLVDNCPGLSSRPDFRALFHLGGTTDRAGADLDIRFGVVTSIGYGRDFGFIRADDGEDFFLHRGNWRSGPWDELRRQSRPRVTFTVAPARADGRLRLARAASFESPAADAGEFPSIL